MSGLDPIQVQSLLAEARDELAAGNEKKAALLLTDAAYDTRDPEIERQVRQLAEQGLKRAGMFGKGRWREIIRIIDSLQGFRTDKESPVTTA